nr:hypothetical protein [Fusobacterium gastrosuis]
MEKEKVLEIKIERMNDEYSAWCITYQNEEILKRGEFSDSELIVYSKKYPCFDIDFEYRLFLKGKDKTLDNTVNIIPNYLVEQLKEMVNAVNEKYGILKRWRAIEYSEYYFLGSHMNILSNYEHYDIIDNERYELGNYFESLEEAEKVKRKLQEFWAKVRAGEIGDDEE